MIGAPSTPSASLATGLGDEPATCAAPKMWVGPSVGSSVLIGDKELLSLQYGMER